MKNLKIKDVIKNEEYPAAIELSVEAMNEISSMQTFGFSCVTDLRVKIRERLDQLEYTLDEKSAQLCLKFDEAIHLKLIDSYEILAKTNMFIDQLSVHFAAACNSASQSAILKFIQVQDIAELRTKQFKSLCEVIFCDIKYAYKKVNWKFF